MQTDWRYILGHGLVCVVRKKKPAAVEESAPRWERSWHVRSELSAGRFAAVHGPVPASNFIPEHPAPVGARA